MAFQGDSIYWVEVEKVVPNPFQPRREFDEHKLAELADSVRMYGILQPLTVTRNEVAREDGTFYTQYELIAGERRLRASKLAGLTQVPVIIREGEDSEQEKLELAIIENLQREDLNAVDRALAFRQLADVFGLSHTQVAKKVGRSREYVSNSIRLLGLPEYMLNSLRLGEMSEGHSRTLLMLNDRPEEQDVVFREILLKKLSVREVERIVRKIATDKVRKKGLYDFDTELIEMEKKFMETLGTRVQIQKTDYGGRLTIDYFSVEDLEGMLNRMKAEKAVVVESKPAEQLAALVANTPLSYTNDVPADTPLVVSAAAALSVGSSIVENESEAQVEEMMNAHDSDAFPAIASAVEQTENEYLAPVLESSEGFAPAVEVFSYPLGQMDEEPDFITTEPAVHQESSLTPEPTEPIRSVDHETVTLYINSDRISYLAPQIISQQRAAAAVEEMLAEPVNDESVEGSGSELDEHAETEAQLEESASIPAPAAVEEDDSSLYSIRHFSI